MPELPEVEVTLRGIKPHVLGKKITNVIIRFPRLRWAIPADLPQKLTGRTLKDMTRRGKYLLLTFANGTLIIHLGMSGRLRIQHREVPIKKHDHVDICFADYYLRFTDPRRFGAILWSETPEKHALLKNIGPEPLTKDFTANYLWQRAQGRKTSIKA